MNGMMVELRNRPLKYRFEVLTTLHRQDIHIIIPTISNSVTIGSENKFKNFYCPEYLNALLIERDRIERYNRDIDLGKHQDMDPMGALESIAKSGDPDNAYILYPLQSLMAEELNLARRISLCTNSGDTFVLCRDTYFRKSEFVAGLNNAIKESARQLLGDQSKRNAIVQIMINDEEYAKQAHWISGAACIPDLLSPVS
jgi:hypothetical protein